MTEYEIKQIQEYLNKKFSSNKFVAKKRKSIDDSCEIFLDDELVGVLTLGWGTKPRHTFGKIFPKVGILEKNKETEEFEHDINDWYYEIGKMCMKPEMPKNSESQMISGVVKWMKKNTNAKFLYTWADGIMGKPGYVYQAANFLYGDYIWTSIYINDKG